MSAKIIRCYPQLNHLAISQINTPRPSLQDVVNNLHSRPVEHRTVDLPDNARFLSRDRRINSRIMSIAVLLDLVRVWRNT